MQVQGLEFLKSNGLFSMGMVAFVLMCANGMAATVVDFNAARDFTTREADIVNADEHTLTWNDSIPLMDGAEGNTGNMKLYGGFSGQGDVEKLQFEHYQGRNTIAFSVVNAKTTTSNLTGQIILLWDAAGFLTPGSKFDETAACSFSLAYNPCANHEGTRFVIRDGDRYFLSSEAGVSELGGTMMDLHPVLSGPNSTRPSFNRLTGHHRISDWPAWDNFRP